MKRVFLVLGAVVVILPWLSGARAKADLIQWSVSESGASVATTPFPGIPGSDTYISLRAQPTTYNGTNSATVTLYSLSAGVGNPALSGPGWNPDFSGPSSHYQLSLTLTDQASGASGNLTFGGYVSGNLPYDHGLSTLTNTFVSPTTQTLQLGQDLYTVTIGPVVLPVSSYPDYYYNGLSASGYPDATLGSISASISVQPLTNSTPEPSTLLLVCLGLPSLGLASWFRRRRS